MQNYGQWVLYKRFGLICESPIERDRCARGAMKICQIMIGRIHDLSKILSVKWRSNQIHDSLKIFHMESPFLPIWCVPKVYVVLQQIGGQDSGKVWSLYWTESSIERDRYARGAMNIPWIKFILDLTFSKSLAYLCKVHGIWHKTCRYQEFQA